MTDVWAGPSSQVVIERRTVGVARLPKTMSQVGVTTPQRRMGAEWE